MEETDMMDVEVKEQISNLIEAIRHIEDANEQQRTALTVSTLLVVRFTESSYAAIGAIEVMKRGVMDSGKVLYE